MKHPVYSVRPRDSIAHARQILEEHRINQLPVVVNGEVIGIVTDRDLRDAFPSVFDVSGYPDELRKPVHDPEKLRVEEVMTQAVLTLAPDDPLADAARVMRQERVGAVPVVEGKRLVGILARSDVLEAFVAAVGGSGPAKPKAAAPKPATPKAAEPPKRRRR
jgi:acetoin utilization protein AcuB